MGIILFFLKDEKGAIGREKNKYKVARKNTGDKKSQNERWQEFTRLAAKILLNGSLNKREVNKE